MIKGQNECLGNDMKNSYDVDIFLNEPVFLTDICSR